MRKHPRVFYSEMTGRIYVATAYKELPQGLVAATTKFDVTQDALSAVIRHIQDYNVETAKEDGSRVRITVVEEPICSGDCNEGHSPCDQCRERGVA